MEERFIISLNNGFELLLDGKVLIKERYNMDDHCRFCYVQEENGKIIHNDIMIFEKKYITYFIDDIKSQINDGVDRNNLKINVPEKISETIKIGNKEINESI